MRRRRDHSLLGVGKLHSLEVLMRRRVRLLAATFVALISVSMSSGLALAQQYNSTLSFTHYRPGACRTYNGTSINIQLTTYVSNGAGDSGKYTISVYRCSGGQLGPLVGGAGTCNYPGFCRFAWAINLGGQQYAFYFKKTAGDYHDIVTSDSVQMWST
jgi:hypothetical protein